MLKKTAVEKVSFLCGSFLTEIRIDHSCDWGDSPIRFFPLAATKKVWDFLSRHGYPLDIRRAPFYTEGDIVE